MQSKSKAAADFLILKGIHAEIGVILGTGLRKLVDEMEIEQEISYTDIPNFATSTVESHAGKLLFGTIAGKKVIILQGRFHYYEGYNFNQVVFPVMVLKMTGIQFLLISNAAGSLNPEFKKGKLMVIEDHINLQPDIPFLKRASKRSDGFNGTVDHYDKQLNNKIFNIALNQRIDICRGVYVSVSGPMLETRAEYRYLRRIGADAVGMSSVPESMTAFSLSIKCCAISVLTDECDPDKLSETNIDEIIAVANSTDVQLAGIYKSLIAEL